MTNRIMSTGVLALIGLAAATAGAQSFRVQCPTSTITHPTAANNNAEPAYTGPTTSSLGAQGFQVPASANCEWSDQVHADLWW